MEFPKPQFPQTELAPDLHETLFELLSNACGTYQDGYTEVAAASRMLALGDDALGIIYKRYLGFPEGSVGAQIGYKMVQTFDFEEQAITARPQTILTATIPSEKPGDDDGKFIETRNLLDGLCDDDVTYHRYLLEDLCPPRDSIDS